MVSFIIIPSNIKEYSKTKKVYETKEYKIVEGEIEQFHPKQAHGTERFTVNNVFFEYSDDDLSDYGYNTAGAGVLKNNLHVRITWFNNGQKNIILKLETE